MNNFSFNKDHTLWKKVFKAIPWYYHLLFLIGGIIPSLLFQVFYLKTWDFPYFFIFLTAIFIMYAILFLVLSPIIKQNWFLHSRGKNEKK